MFGARRLNKNIIFLPFPTHNLYGLKSHQHAKFDCLILLSKMFFAKKLKAFFRAQQTHTTECSKQNHCDGGEQRNR